jgi:Tol biopolymer transport system component
MNADGTGQTRITNNPAADLLSSWAPNNNQIAFSSARNGNLEVYRMGVDGSAQTRLTNNPAFDAFVDWSPDSSQIVFTSDRTGNSEILRMNASNGGGIVNLSRNGALDAYPAW